MARALDPANAASARSEGPPRRAPFLLRRAHSLAGVLPIGGFLVLHLWTNAAALGGQARFDEAVDRIQRLPALGALEVLFIFVPLAFHAGYGVVLAREGRPNAGAYPLPANWRYILQRASGVVALLFVAGHLWELRAQKLLFGLGPRAFYPTLAAHLSGAWGGVAWIAIGYMLGVLACVYHFANGLYTASITWGLVVSSAARRRVGLATAGIGAVLGAVGVATILAFATGTSFNPWRDDPERGPCGPEAVPPPSAAPSSTAGSPPFPSAQSRPTP